MRMPVFLIITLKILALTLVFSALQTQPAHADRGLNEKPRKSAFGFYCEKGLAPATFRGNRVCRPCGKADGQPACEEKRIGPTCGNRLIEVGSKCKSCGGRGEVACPKIEWGYPCEGSMAPDANGVCNPCGGRNQSACRALKPGEQCGSWLDKNSSNICKPCGGNGEPNCRVIKAGSICKPGLGSFDGTCRACGSKDERACPAMEQGRQCEEWTTNRDGYCRPCGTVATGACRVTDKGKACQDGLQWTVNGQCKMTEKSALKAQAIADFEAMGNDTLDSFISSAVSLREDEAYAESLDESDEDSPPPPPNVSCPDSVHQSYTVGIVGGAQVGVGVSGEVGAAFRCESTPGLGNDSKWYSGGAISYGLQFNAEAGVTFGIWESEVNQLRGKVHGWTFDLFDLAKLASKGSIKAPTVKIKGVPVTPSIVVGLWYARKDTDMDGNGNWDFDYQGMTLTITGVVGDGIGPEYVRATTNQVCDYEMGCAIGNWFEVDGDDARVTNGVAITVKERTSEYIIVDVFAGGAPRRDVTFDRDTWADKRDYKLLDDEDKVEERICFRNNFRVLRYMDEDRNCDRGLKLIMPGVDKDEDEEKYSDGTITTDASARSPGQSVENGSDNVMSPRWRDLHLEVDGDWDMKTGNGMVAYTIKRGKGFVLMRSVASGKAVVYRQVKDKVYRSDAGAQLTFANARAAIWQSASGNVRYAVQMR